jgi:hypothetical protein
MIWRDVPPTGSIVHPPDCADAAPGENSIAAASAAEKAKGNHVSIRINAPVTTPALAGAGHNTRIESQRMLKSCIAVR